MRIIDHQLWQYRRFAGTALLTAATACLACSPPADWTPTEWTEAPVVYNTSEQAVVLRLQWPEAQLLLNCHEIAQDPGRYIPESAFGPAQRYEVAPDQAISVLTLSGRWSNECEAVLMQVDGHAPRVLFWQVGDIDGRSVPDSSPKVPHMEAVIVLDNNGDGLPKQLRDVDGSWLHELEQPTPERGDCSLQQEQWQLWGGAIPDNADRLLQRVTKLRDGCLRVEIPHTSPIQDEVAVTQDDLSANVINICVPEDAFPFEEGEVIRFDNTDNSVVLSTRSGIRQLLLLQSQPDRYVQAGIEIAPHEYFGCDFETQEEAATTRRAARLNFDTAWGQFDLGPGEQNVVRTDTTRVVAGVTAANERALGPELGFTFSAYVMREEI